MLEFDSVTTRGGDRGESSLYDGRRLRKDDLLFETVGDIDELSSFLGVARAALPRRGLAERAIHKTIEMVQRDLIRLGAQVAASPSDDLFKRIEKIAASDVERIEKIEHRYLKRADIPQQFVLPGATLPSAHIDVARAVCRRSERRIVACIRDRGMAHLVDCQRYLNRLSDLLFVIGRVLAEKAR